MAIYEIQVEKLTQDISQPQELRWRIFEIAKGSTSGISDPKTYIPLQENYIRSDPDTNWSTINKQCENGTVGWLYNHDQYCSGNFGITVGTPASITMLSRRETTIFYQSANCLAKTLYV